MAEWALCTLQVNCETDFVARNAEFVSLVGEVAQAALSKPSDYRGKALRRHVYLPFVRWCV
jgi:translation elongation factor EF-Ts